jgi:ATP-dependent Clp protease ATP-binding subunit ClpC
MAADTNDSPFQPDGALREQEFGHTGREVLREMKSWLRELHRGMYLPLDLMIVLLERGHDELGELVAEGGQEQVDPPETLRRLKRLADEIKHDADYDDKEAPSLQKDTSSQGLVRILGEARELAAMRDPEAPAIEEGDLLKPVVWRAEAVESASVRWAIRRLGEGDADEMFDDKGLLERESFHDTSWRILQGAMKLAANRGTPFLGTPHLLAMLCSVKDSIIWRSAKERGLEPSRLREELLRLIGSESDELPEFMIGRKTLTPRMIRILSHAASESAGAPIKESHLVEAFLDDGGSSLELMQALGLESEIRQALGEPKVLEGSPPVDAAIEFAEGSDSTPTLDLLGRDLTQEALEGELPEIVGRQKELQRMMNVLLRKEQRNPLLTGEAGVGKTALATALAERIAVGRVPPQLQGCRLVEINGASLIGGTSYRGDLESRIESLIEEASGRVILFIDEAHAVFAPRSGSQTPGEVPNHFKRALASGDLAVVAATTESEYRRWIERDPALKRRFERIEIREPDRSVVRNILETLVPEMERSYGVTVQEETLSAAIDMSVRYLPQEWLPDKAKKLLMDACIASSNAAYAESDGDEQEDEQEDGASHQSSRPEVSEVHIAEQIHLKTSIPREQILAGDRRWWEGLADELHAEVVGQPTAASRVAHTLVEARLRNADRNRPMAVLAFAGPAGVGKGRMAECLAEVVFNDPRAVHRLDMSDYQEAHSLSRLIGSPPGYVGYEDDDILVTPLRRRPSSVVILEDFDRAHPRIQQRMLRMMQEGEISDTRGQRADVSNAIFVLTLTADIRETSGGIGFSERSDGARSDEIEPEDLLENETLDRLANEIDGVVPFVDLCAETSDPARELLSERIDRFVSSMREEYHLEVVISESLRQALEDRATDVRSLDDADEVVTEWLYEPMTSALIGGRIDGQARLEWEDGAVQVVVGAD